MATELPDPASPEASNEWDPSTFNIGAPGGAGEGDSDNSSSTDIEQLDLMGSADSATLRSNFENSPASDRRYDNVETVLYPLSLPPPSTLHPLHPLLPLPPPPPPSTLHPLLPPFTLPPPPSTPSPTPSFHLFLPSLQNLLQEG